MKLQLPSNRLPPPTWTPTPSPVEAASRLWVPLVLVIACISSGFLIKFLLQCLFRSRESNSEVDRQWADSPTEPENGQGNLQLVGQYRDEEDNPHNPARSLASDGPYEAGVRGLAPCEPRNLNAAQATYRYNNETLAPNLVNAKEIRRIIAQLNHLDNDQENENLERREALQQQVTELLMADPRYTFVQSSSSRSFPVDPPPAYSDLAQ